MEYSYSDEEFEVDLEDETEAAASIRFAKDSRVFCKDTDYSYSDEEFEVDSEDETEAAASIRLVKDTRDCLMGNLTPFLAEATPGRPCIKPRASARPPRRERNKLAFGGTEVKLYYESEEERLFKETRPRNVTLYSTSRIKTDELEDLDLFVSRRLKYKKADVDGKHTCLEEAAEFGQSTGEAGGLIQHVSHAPKTAHHQETSTELDRSGGGKAKIEVSLNLSHSEGSSDVQIPALGHNPETGLVEGEYEQPTSWDAVSRAREWQKTTPRGRDRFRVGLLSTTSAPSLPKKPRHDYMPTQSRSADMSRERSHPCRSQHEEKECRCQLQCLSPKELETISRQLSVPNEGARIFVTPATSSKLHLEGDRVTNKPNRNRHDERHTVDNPKSRVNENNSTGDIKMHTPRESPRSLHPSRTDSDRSPVSNMAPISATCAIPITQMSGTAVPRPHSHLGRGRIDEGHRPNTFSGCRTSVRPKPRSRGKSRVNKPAEPNFSKPDTNASSSTNFVTSPCNDTQNSRPVSRLSTAHAGFSETPASIPSCQHSAAARAREVHSAHVLSQCDIFTNSPKQRRLGEIMVSIRQRLRRLKERLSSFNCFS